MCTTVDKIKRISISNKDILNAKELFGSDLTLKITFHSYLPQQSSSLYTLLYSTTKNFTIGFDCKVSKDQTFQSISQDLLDSSSEEIGFVYDLLIEADHYELQKQESLSSNNNIQSNTLFEKSGYTNNSKTTSYRNKSTKLKNVK